MARSLANMADRVTSSFCFTNRKVLYLRMSGRTRGPQSHRTMNHTGLPTKGVGGAGRFGSGGWQSSVYTGFEIMTLSFNKNFRLKFRKFHVPNGTELSDYPDTTQANARSCKFRANQRDSNDIDVCSRQREH